MSKEGISMSQKKYRVALIGCGSMGATHLNGIISKDNVIIECVCDTSFDRAEEFRRRYSANLAETDYKKVVSMDSVDIVIIATYPGTHMEILEACIANSKHVICEKPLARNLETGRRMVELIKAHPECKVLIGHILRHHHAYKKVADMIASGAIGSPIVMRMTQNHHTMDWKRYLRLIEETSPILDCGVHYIDVMRWFTGAEIKDISGVGLRTEPDVPDGNYNYGLITARLTDGSVAYYEAGWSNTMSSDNLKEFIGPKGRIKITYRMFRTSNREEGDLVEYYKYPEKTYETINISCERKPTGEQMEELISMIEGRSLGTPTIDEVYESFFWASKADEIIRQNL